MGSIPIRGAAMYDVARAVEVCANEPASKFKSGVHARFFDLGNGWGAKYFLYKDQRDENYNLQSDLAEHNLAPETGVKFEFHRSGQEMYGYFTKVVIPYEEYYSDLYTQESDDRLFQIGRSLKLEAEEHGLYVTDLHDANIGWDEDDQNWKIIDCSVAGEDDSERYKWDYHRWEGIE